MGDEHVRVAIVVEIATVDTHARLRSAIAADGGPRKQRLILERATTPIHPEEVLMHVVGYIDIDPPVAVHVGGGNAQRRPEVGSQERGGGHVHKRTVAQVPIQPVDLRRIHLGRAVVSLAGQTGALAVGLDLVLDVVAHVQVEPPIAVVVDKRRRDSPSAIVGPAFLGHVGERAIAVVPEQLIRSEIRQVDIDAPIIGYVAGRDPHAVSGRVDSAFVRHIGESERPLVVDSQVVPVETPLQGERSAVWQHRLVLDGAVAKRTSLYQIHIEVAVVVVVEQASPAGKHFREVELARHAVEVREGEPEILSSLREPVVTVAFDGITGAGRTRLWRRVGGCRSTVGAVVHAACAEHGGQQQRDADGVRTRAGGHTDQCDVVPMVSRRRALQQIGALTRESLCLPKTSSSLCT